MANSISSPSLKNDFTLIDPKKHHTSTNNLVLTINNKPENTKMTSSLHKKSKNLSIDASSEPQLLSQSTVSSIDSQRNANRISVNTDLLSRVEKEKKVYEARISDLTQLTEMRKVEIEKLTFELRRAKKEAQDATEIASETQNELVMLKKQFEDINGTSKSLCGRNTSSTTDSIQSLPTDTIRPKKIEDKNLARDDTYSSADATSISHPLNRLRYCSPPDSLGTTTRMTAGGATTVITGTITVSSASSEWDESNRGIDASNASVDARESDTGLSIDDPPPIQPQNALSVANLQGRLLQMEEDNYTTTEELQATLQELCDLQRSLDEAHEENRNLAFERAILLESLCTQTAKLEHCRLQIDQLKYLLLTDRAAQTPDTREAHFCKLYASIEQEKQDLLTQNNELAQSSDGLAQECRILTEKIALLQDSFDAIENEHAALTKAYQLAIVKIESIQQAEETLKAAHSGSSESYIQNFAVDYSLGSCIQAEDEDITHFYWNSTGSAITKICPHMANHEKAEEQLRDLQKDNEDLRERFQLLESEHERQLTEWRLYERDLLKTVQVADGIKAESEEEMKRMARENHCLREQVIRL
ncbi:unnamed protein product [Protopolystoma xenopodis]|uniref:Uncharacterized protein n=1 Tax=Protopolystoma xenopodis TaxID=117903 RepID=A0A448WVM0_9PLAT|nr:unnamed protein product [Protopolystoma xenopodis]